MLTYSFNFFIITKRISDWHHFCKWKFLWSILQMAVSVGTMQLTLSMAIIQVPISVAVMHVLRFCCNYVGGTFCYSYAGGSFCYNYAPDRFHCNYAIRSFCSIYADEGFAANMWVTIFIEIMQVVFSAVHYAHDSVAVSVVAMYVTVSSRNVIYLFLTDTHFS